MHPSLMPPQAMTAFRAPNIATKKRKTTMRQQEFFIFQPYIPCALRTCLDGEKKEKAKLTTNSPIHSIW